MTAQAPDLDRLLGDPLLGEVAWLRHLAHRLCRDEHVADDAVQETVAAALQHPPREASGRRGYLLRILHNVLRGGRRAAARRVHREHAYAVLRDDAVPGTAELVARAELHRALVEQVLRLPPAWREVVLLHHFEGVDVAAIAARTTRTPDAVRALLRRARDELRERLADQHLSDGRPALLAAVPTTTAVATGSSVAASVSFGVFAMKTKLWIAAAVVAVVGIAVPTLAWQSSPASRPEAVVALEPAATPAERPDTPRSAPTSPATDIERNAAPALLRSLAGQLAGIDPRAPWRAPLTVQATWRDGDEIVRRDVEAAVDASGTFAIGLPGWNATSTGLHLDCAADDASYEPLRLQRDLTDGETVLQCDVVPATIVCGRAVAPDGTAVADARVLAFAVDKGLPRAPKLHDVVTADDGTWRLRLTSPGAEVLTVVLPPEQRRDVVLNSVIRAVRGITDLGDVTLPEPALVTGTVRWPDGSPVDEAALQWTPPRGVSLDEQLRLNWGDGGVRRLLFASTGPDGRFELPLASGESGIVGLRSVGNFRVFGLSSSVTVRATAPQHVEIVAVGRPMTFRVLQDGRPAGRCRLEWRGKSFATTFSTDEHGVVQQLLPDGASRARARDQDDTLASDWNEVPPTGDEMILQLLPVDGVPVVVRLDHSDGSLVSFAWTCSSDDSVRGSRTLLDVKQGVFEMHAPAAADRLRVIGLRDSHVMPTELTVALPPAGELLVPVQLGGRMKLLVTDGAGAFLSGHYRLEQNAQAVPPAGLARPGTAPPTTLPLPAAAERPSELFAPGSYELVLDLGERGEHRRPVVLEGGRTIDVRVVVP